MTDIQLQTLTVAVHSRPYVISVPHASAGVPAWSRADPEDRVFQTHEGVDIGAKDLGEHLGGLIGARVVCAPCSRLLIDCNRPAGADAIRQTTVDGRPLAFNIGLEPGEIAARSNLHHAYHRRLNETLDGVIQQARHAKLIDLHSFTRHYAGQPAREVDIGICIPENGELGEGLLGALTARASQPSFWVTHDNTHRPAVIRRDEPYPGTHPGAHIGRAFQSSEIQTVTIEVCNDLLTTSDEIVAMSRLLAQAIHDAMQTEGDA